MDNEPIPATSHTGLADNTAGGSYYTANTDRRLYFNVLAPMVLQSVTIYANTAGSRQIEVLDSSGNSLALSSSFSAVAGKNVVPLNMTLPAGNNYAIKLSATSAMDLFRNNAGVAFPYTVGGLVSITNSDAATTPGSYYYYFYDWVVSTPGCVSSRAAVVGTINTATGIQNLTANGSLKVYPNPNTGLFTIDGLDRENSIEVYDVVGKLVYQTVTSNPTQSVDLTGKESGVYFYRIMNLGSKEISTGKVVLY